MIQKLIKEKCKATPTLEWRSSLVKEVEKYITVDPPQPWEQPPMDLLNVRNGLLRVADRKLLPRSPKQETNKAPGNGAVVPAPALGSEYMLYGAMNTLVPPGGVEPPFSD